MAVLRFMRKGKGNAAALADWVGKVGFNEALPHVAKHVTGGDRERAKKVVGKLKGKAKKRGTLKPEHAYGAGAKGGPAASNVDMLKDGAPAAKPPTVAGWNKIKPTAAIAQKQYGQKNPNWFKALMERQREFLKGIRPLTEMGRRRIAAKDPANRVGQPAKTGYVPQTAATVKQQGRFVPQTAGTVNAPLAKSEHGSCTLCQKPLSHEDKSGGYTSCAGCRKPRPYDEARQTNLFAKGRGKGPGSRGGKILGYTKSGKPVYAGREAQHPDHTNWSKQDHHDAAELHRENYARHSKFEDKAAKEGFEAEGAPKSGWGKYEAAVPKARPGRSWSEKYHKPMYESMRRVERDREIIRGHEREANKAETRKRDARDWGEHEPRSDVRQGQGRQHAKFMREYMQTPKAKRAWGPPPGAVAKASFLDAQRMFSKTTRIDWNKFPKPKCEKCGQEQHPIDMMTREGKSKLCPGCRGDKPLMAKASGEGSRGGHVIGHTKSGKAIYGPGHAAYTTRMKMPKWNVEPSALHEPKVARRMGSFADWSKEDHLDAARAHADERNKHNSAHNALSAAALSEHGSQGSLVSGVVRDHFPDDTKNQLRTHAHAASAHGDAAHLHYKLAGKRSPFGTSEFAKARGEGSRGGQVIGHTRSGKPVYQRHDDPRHAKFSRHDHEDAAELHQMAHEQFPGAHPHGPEQAAAHRRLASPGQGKGQSGDLFAGRGKSEERAAHLAKLGYDPTKKTSSEHVEAASDLFSKLQSGGGRTPIPTSDDEWRAAAKKKKSVFDEHSKLLERLRDTHGSTQEQAESDALIERVRAKNAPRPGATRPRTTDEQIAADRERDAIRRLKKARMVATGGVVFVG